MTATLCYTHATQIQQVIPHPQSYLRIEKEMFRPTDINHCQMFL